MIRLVIGALLLVAVVAAAVSAAQTSWAAPFGLAVAVIGGLFVFRNDRGPIR
jgi:hypothetical protein